MALILEHNECHGQHCGEKTVNECSSPLDNVMPPLVPSPVYVATLLPRMSLARSVSIVDITFSRSSSYMMHRIMSDPLSAVTKLRGREIGTTLNLPRPPTKAKCWGFPI